MIVKYFYENTDENYDEYNQIWDENRERMIFLYDNLSLTNQMNSIIHDINDNENKDILSIRFPTYRTIKENKIINDIILGKGIVYANKTWYPKEVWIYSPK